MPSMRIYESSNFPDLIGHDVPGQVVKAGKSTRRYAMP
ncbi:hypothetical protein EHLJMEHL_03717 [Vreelandella titanicae]